MEVVRTEKVVQYTVSVKVWHGFNIVAVPQYTIGSAEVH